MPIEMYVYPGQKLVCMSVCDRVGPRLATTCVGSLAVAQRGAVQVGAMEGAWISDCRPYKGVS